MSDSFDWRLNNGTGTNQILAWKDIIEYLGTFKPNNILECPTSYDISMGVGSGGAYTVTLLRNLSPNQLVEYSDCSFTSTVKYITMRVYIDIRISGYKLHAFGLEGKQSSYSTDKEYSYTDNIPNYFDFSVREDEIITQVYIALSDSNMMLHTVSSYNLNVPVSTSRTITILSTSQLTFN